MNFLVITLLTHHLKISSIFGFVWTWDALWINKCGRCPLALTEFKTNPSLSCCWTGIKCSKYIFALYQNAYIFIESIPKLSAFYLEFASIFNRSMKSGDQDEGKVCFFLFWQCCISVVVDFSVEALSRCCFSIKSRSSTPQICKHSFSTWFTYYDDIELKYIPIISANKH